MRLCGTRFRGDVFETAPRTTFFRCVEKGTALDRCCDYERDTTCAEAEQTFPMCEAAQVPEKCGIQRQGRKETRAVRSEEQRGTQMKQSIEENLSEAKDKSVT